MQAAIYMARDNLFLMDSVGTVKLASFPIDLSGLKKKVSGLIIIVCMQIDTVLCLLVVIIIIRVTFLREDGLLNPVL